MTLKLGGNAASETKGMGESPSQTWLFQQHRALGGEAGKNPQEPSEEPNNGPQAREQGEAGTLAARWGGAAGPPGHL